MDATGWKDLISVAAAGNSSTAQYYDYTHQSPAPGINYYRILQTDLDGSNSYSEIKRVAWEDKVKSFVLKNNVVTNGTLLIQANEKTSLFLFNTEGKLLLKKQLTTGLHDIPVHGLVKGVYILQAGDIREKILVQ